MDNMDNSQPPPAIPQLPSVSQHSPPLSPPVLDVLDENALLATVISTPPNALATAVVDNSPEVNIRDMVRGHWSGSTFWQPKSLVTEFDPSPLLQHFDAVYTMWKDRLLITDTEFDDVSLADMSLAVSNEPDPLTWANAMASPNNRWWLQAAYQEMCQLARMGTFDFIDTPPPQRKALATKWVWKTKRLPDGKIERFKARWVARGDLQKKGTDYVETFAPVAMLVSIRVLLTLVALLDLELDQLDVVGAFLHGGLDSEVYLRQRVGFALVGDTRVCALRKSLYGLCQAARAWYNVLHNTLQELGFQRLSTDTAVWKILSASLQFVAAHVDDMLCGGSRDSVERTKSFLSSKFEVRDMGPASVFIALRIVRDRERRLMYIDQSHYGRDILDLYNMADCNPCLVPMNPANQHLSKALASECLDDTQKRHYQSILGSLGYLMNCSRPDLAFAVNKLSQFASAPAKRHLIALKRVLRYLRSTTDSRLLIGAEFGTDFITAPDSPSLPLVELRGWFDASWADNPDDSRSTFGYTILYGHTALIWKSKKHKGVTLSTTDAEYLAATEITREICFLQNLFGDLQVPFKTYCFMPISFYSLPTSFLYTGKPHYHAFRCYTGPSFPLPFPSLLYWAIVPTTITQFLPFTFYTGYIPLPIFCLLIYRARFSLPVCWLFIVVLFTDLLHASFILVVRYLYTGITSTRITLPTTMPTPVELATLLYANGSYLRRLGMDWCKYSRLILLNKPLIFSQNRSERMYYASVRSRSVLNSLSSLSFALYVLMGLIAIICYINIYAAHTIHPHINPLLLHPLCPSGANCP